MDEELIYVKYDEYDYEGEYVYLATTDRDRAFFIDPPESIRYMKDRRVDTYNKDGVLLKTHYFDTSSMTWELQKHPRI